MSALTQIPVAMLTTEIADLTGKKHLHVMRDTRKMLVELHGEGALSNFGSSYLAGNGKQEPCYRLPKRETMVLVTGYSIPLRAAVIDRLEELEAELRAKADSDLFPPPGNEPLTRDQFREDLNKALKHIRQQVIEQVEQRVLASVKTSLGRGPSQTAMEFALGCALDKELPRLFSGVKGILRNQDNWRAAGLLPAPLPTDETTFVTSTEVCWMVVPDEDLHRDMPGLVGKRLLSHSRKHKWPQGETERRSRRDREMPTYPVSRVKEWLAAGGRTFIEQENRARHSVDAQPAQSVIHFPGRSQ